MDVSKMIPEQGFFPEYVRYASTLTDAPEIYHVGAALAVHSAVCANHVEVYFPTSKTKDTTGEQRTVIGEGVENRTPGQSIELAWSPSHLWVLLVGPSGDARKSTAVTLATEVAGSLITEQTAGEITSPASTFDWVSRHPDAFFVYSEGAALFSMFNASYWQEGQGLFPKLYDGLNMKKQLVGGRRTKNNPSPDPIEIEIIRPRVSLLVGVATAHLDAARSTDWTGGLIGRMLLLYAERERHDPIPGKTNEGEKDRLHTLLKAERQYVLDTYGNKGKEMVIGIKSAAGETYMDWSTKIDDLQRTKAPKVRALYNRLPQHVLRVAAHYTLSQGHNAIGIQSMQAAVEFGNFCVTSIDRIAELLTDDKVLRTAVRLRDFLRAHKSEVVSYRTIMKSLSLSEHGLKYAIESLTAAGEIRSFVSQGSQEKFLLKCTPAPHDRLPGKLPQKAVG